MIWYMSNIHVKIGVLGSCSNNGQARWMDCNIDEKMLSQISPLFRLEKHQPNVVFKTNLNQSCFFWIELALAKNGKHLGPNICYFLNNYIQALFQNDVIKSQPLGRPGSLVSQASATLQTRVQIQAGQEMTMQIDCFS